MRGGGHYTFTLPEARRTYLSSAAFEGSPESGVEWALAHELTHLNDPRAPALQQQFDAEIDRTARDRLGRWLSDPQATAYRKLQGIARQAFRGVEPQPSPIAAELSPPPLVPISWGGIGETIWDRLARNLWEAMRQSR